MSRRRPRSNHVDYRMARNLDNLAAFEELFSDMPKELKGDVMKKLPSEKIFEKYENLAAARIVAIALTEKDPAKALAASKEIHDRLHGKPKEKKEVHHKYENLSDEELNALLLSSSTAEPEPQEQ